MRTNRPFTSTTVGVLLSMAGLILVYQNQPFLGIPLFVAGIIVMNKKRKK